MTSRQPVRPELEMTFRLDGLTNTSMRPVIHTPYQFRSLASRVKGMHWALNANELAKLLGVAKVTIFAVGRNGERFHQIVGL